MQDILDFNIPFYDVDSMGVVWHGNYVKYMENGRCSFLAKRELPYDQMEESGYLFPVINIQVKYIRPCRFGQRVRLITELDPKYVRLSSEVRNDDVSVSEIASSGVHVTAGRFKIDIDNNVNTSVLQDTLRILQRLC